MDKPVVVDVADIPRYAPDDHCFHVDGEKRVVVDENDVPGNVCSVFAVSSSVHIEAVAVGVLQDHVVPGLVAGIRPASARDVVTAPVEQVGFDECFGVVHHHAVAQTVALIVVDIVVVDVVVR